jgi:hypothetical protein
MEKLEKKKEKLFLAITISIYQRRRKLIQIYVKNAAFFNKIIFNSKDRLLKINPKLAQVLSWRRKKHVPFISKFHSQKKYNIKICH